MPVSEPLPADLQSLLPLNVNHVQLAQKQLCDPWLGQLALYLISNNLQSNLSHYSKEICKWVLSMAKGLLMVYFSIWMSSLLILAIFVFSFHLTQCYSIILFKLTVTLQLECIAGEMQLIMLSLGTLTGRAYLNMYAIGFVTVIIAFI